jgi:deazaflavin-dependent oxidoreductase (nitroreductase family)
VKPIGAVLSSYAPTRFPRWHVKVYRFSRGSVGHKWTGFPCLLLTTRGRQSGLPRHTVLTYVDDGLGYVVAASNGGSDRPPAWYLNLVAEPTVALRVGRHSMSALATPFVAGSTEYENAWGRLNALRNGRYDMYQESTDRRIVLVRLEPTRAHTRPDI